MANLLKRLELNGFKSFAQKTVFDFSHGITAIVGPNGSGKSNVIDAIRWLLGEREAKNLRGAKVEDLIFAGTAKRPRMGLAQATLHFDNVDDFFGVGASEVSISREVARDGTSRYFVNNSEVRLKNLVDFLAQARLGAKGMVVVSQGNSDMFIQASPMARREMIEEMLGLREYQLKKSEAERRLKNTQINLDKARALIEEILPHLRSLKRQTGRWERRGAIAEELKSLEDQFFGKEAHELKTHLLALDTELNSRSKARAGLEAELRAAEAHLKKVEEGQPEGRKELSLLKSKAQELISRRSGMQKDIGRLEAQIEMTANTAGSPTLPPAGLLTEFLTNLREKLASLAETDVEYEDLRDSLREILADIEDILGRKSSRSESVSDGLESQLKKISGELQSIEKQIALITEEEKKLEQGQEEFYGVFKAAVANMEAAKDKLEKWGLENKEKLFEKERILIRREEWERQVREAGRDPKEFAAVEVQEGPFDRENFQKRIFRLRGELAVMGEVDESLLKEAHEVQQRYEFLERESGDLEKAKGDLRKLILELQTKVKSEFSSALLKINEEFDKFFNVMFGGGHAKLKIVVQETPKPKIEATSETEEVKPSKDAVPEDILEEEPEEGIEVDLKLPRKKIASIDVLSGGEKSLVGIAALFALISVSPPPFLVLDEIDAPLDERNARRFADMLKEFSKHTQFVLVTHNRATMEAADMLYGVTMDEDATSKVVSLKLEPQPA